MSGDKSQPNSYYERNRERILARLAAKYKSDAKFRKKARKAARDRYHKDEEYRDATIQRAMARYQRLKREKN